MQDHSRESLKQARRLRRDMSLPERLLWRELRGGPAGIKFRRQHPLGAFVIDFYCASKWIAIEIDGIAHGMGDRPARDASRDRWLAKQGVRVLRVTASDVLNDPVEVAGSLVVCCQNSPPPSAAGAAATSPNGGGLSGAPA